MKKQYFCAKVGQTLTLVHLKTQNTLKKHPLNYLEFFKIGLFFFGISHPINSSFGPIGLKLVF
jgi:hypothetical protein